MLSVARTIPLQDWMTSPESRAVFSALQNKAVQPQVLFVGGCVRNAVLGLLSGDCDLATIHPPFEVTRRLEEAGIKVVPTGIDHGTVTAVAGGKPFEITTLRRDVQTDGRHAVIAFTQDWNLDAQRRDFTINTLLADASGQVYDPTGQGIADLEAGRVIFVGDPAQRIAEDYLRILRFFRFHAFYGRGEPDAAALAACREAAENISTLSRERITQEMLKIVAVDHPADILEIMFAHNVMKDFAHPDSIVCNLNMLTGLQKRLGSVSVAARLAFLCAGDIDHLPVIEKYLLFSNAGRRVLESLLKAIRSPLGMKGRLYHYGRDVGGQSILILAAMAGAVIRDDDLELIRHWEIPEFPVTGADLKEMGIAEGPRMGEILEDTETWWVEWDFQPDRAQCLERARGMIKEN
jgi:poly(A) polymerase